MTEGERIFDEGKSDLWQTFTLCTDKDGKRWIQWGNYWYNAEMDINDDDGDKTWRFVSEAVEFTLDDYLKLVRAHKDPMDTPTYWNRSCDYIEDLTKEKARRDFITCFDHTEKLDMELITEDTPDGDYIGRYKGLREAAE